MKVVPRVRNAPFKKRLAFALGGLLTRLLPKRAREVECGDRVNSRLFIDRLIRNGLRAAAIEAKDYHKLRDMHRDNWKVEGAVFAEAYGYRFEEEFLKHDAAIFDLVLEKQHSTPIKHVFEVGCGNGRVLDYLSSKLASVDTMTGIDIDQEQIDRNCETYASSALRFIAADARQWLPENAGPESLVVSNGGVLEYFLEEELAELFRDLRDNGCPAIALIETFGADHDLAHSTSSTPYGPELSFSHNYPHLLRNAGFKITHQSERISQSGKRWMRILAIA